MDPKHNTILMEPAELPTRVVLRVHLPSGEVEERSYILRLTRRGRLLLNRDEFTGNQAA